VLLSIAGLDPSGGAGILADMETFGRLGCAGRAVATAITAQNQKEVLQVHPIHPQWIREQVDALLRKEKPRAVKIGMLGNAPIVREVRNLLDCFQRIPVVLDPVLCSSSGVPLLNEEGIREMIRLLFPWVTLLKPNWGEAEQLLGRRIHGVNEAIRAAQDLMELGPSAVVITGGDQGGDPVDVLADDRGEKVFRSRRVAAHFSRGTGCRFTSAAAVFLSRGMELRDAVSGARAHVRLYLRGLKKKKRGETAV
jgi:hydroxymethylpyrimidine kinase/phosphomethylpyrimidine kinase